MPWRPPISFALASSAAGEKASPLMRTGLPASKSTSTYSALSGAFSGDDRQREHVVVRLAPRILEDAALVADVQQVAVGAVGLLARHRNGDAVLLGVGDQLGARGEIPDAPRRDDLDVRLEGVGGELEAHLVVALAGGAVRDRVGALGAGDFDLPLGDQRPRDRGAEQVDVLVHRRGAQHRKDEVADELLAQVVDVDLRRAARFRLPAHRLELLALAEVGAEGHHRHLIALDQPLEDDGGVEAAGVRENDLLGFDVHGRPSREKACAGAPVRRCASTAVGRVHRHGRTGALAH